MAAKVPALPSWKIRQDKVRLEFFVSGGERFSGTLRWFDEDAFALY